MTPMKNFALSSGIVSPLKLPGEEAIPQMTWRKVLMGGTDPLTKDMKDIYLQQVLDTNEWDFEQKQLDKDEKDKKKAYRHAKRHGLLPSGPVHIRIDTDADDGEGDGTEIEKTIVHAPWKDHTG